MKGIISIWHSIIPYVTAIWISSFSYSIWKSRKNEVELESVGYEKIYFVKGQRLNYVTRRIASATTLLMIIELISIVISKMVR